MDSKGNLILFLGKCSMPFFKGKLKSYNSLFHINNSTDGVKKRSSQNNGTRSIAFNIQNKKINGNIIIIRSKNIMNPPQSSLNSGVNMMHSYNTFIQRFKSSLSYKLLGIIQELAPRSHSIAIKIIQFYSYSGIPTML